MKKMLMLLCFSCCVLTLVKAQTPKQNLKDNKRKAEAAKADVFIMKAKRKLTDSLSFKKVDSVAHKKP